MGRSRPSSIWAGIVLLVSSVLSALPAGGEPVMNPNLKQQPFLHAAPLPRPLRYYSPTSPKYYLKPKQYPKQYYPEYIKYNVVRHLDLNESTVCGIWPALNEDLYHNTYDAQEFLNKYYTEYGTALTTRNDVNPFGSGPWRVVIADEYGEFVCQGVVVHYRQILSLASCVKGHYPLERLRVRYGEWDVLNNENEYEAYENYESRICRVLPVTCDSFGYGYSNLSGELVLLQVEITEDYDKYPHIKPACLPVWPHAPPSHSFSPATVPSSLPYSIGSSRPMVNSEDVPSGCWVSGWHGSPLAILKNHQHPEGTTFSYAPKDFNPYNSIYYYKISQIQRKSKVKRVPGYSRSYTFGKCQHEEQQWVGVEGYDACVADKGSAIVCLVDEHPSSSYNPSNNRNSYSYSYPAPNYASYAYHKDIPVIAAQAKKRRQRLVVVALVKETTSCTDYENKDYSDGYGQLTSNPITAIKVDTEDVNFIVDKFFQGALDYACPSPVMSAYPEPSYYPDSKL